MYDLFMLDVHIKIVHTEDSSPVGAWGRLLSPCLGNPLAFVVQSIRTETFEITNPTLHAWTYSIKINYVAILSQKALENSEKQLLSSWILEQISPLQSKRRPSPNLIVQDTF